MEAVLSGQAGLAVVLGNRPQMRTIDGTVKELGRIANPGALFADCFDVVRRHVKNVREVDKLLRSAWEVDRALTLSLIAFEDDLDAEEEERLLGRVGGLIASPTIWEQVVARLCASPLPDEWSVRATRWESEETRWGELCSELLKLQMSVGRVRQAFDTLDPALFESPAHRAGFLSALVVDGSMRDLARVLTKGEAVGFVALALRGRHRSLPNAFAILDQWLSPFQASKRTGHERRDRMVADAPEEIPVPLVGNSGQAARRAYESAMGQQAAIIQRVKAGDLENARRFADELVSEQSLTNAPQYIAMSLSRLSHLAKELDVPELQLEWALRAVEVFADDPKTHGHLADALIGLRRFGEAEAALADCEKLGDELYAATGRARILRLAGRFSDAYDLYRSAAEKYSSQDEVVYALMGEMETLRDLGRVDDALRGYESLTKQYPLEAMFAMGVASCLAELGDVAGARRAFGVASVKLSGGPAALNGQAALSKAIGELDGAVKLYEAVLEDYPFNPVARCGLADTYRLRGDFELALAEYDAVIGRNPFNVVAVVGKADALRDAGRVSDASSLLEASLKSFSLFPIFHLCRARMFERLDRPNVAFPIYDWLITTYPSFRPAQLARADYLRKLGNFEHADLSYKRILIRYPGNLEARIGRAACLMAGKKFSEADKILPDLSPRTRVEWSAYVLRGMLQSDLGAHKAAIRSLERGIERCPFFKTKRTIRNMIAVLHLQRRKYAEAAKASVDVVGDPLNIIHIHALAANHKTGKAREVFAQNWTTPMPSNVRYLNEQVAKLFGLAPGVAERDRGWVANEERSLLLAAA